MSWLRDHFYRFVFPAFMASGKLSTELGEPKDVKPAKAAPTHLPAELQKLWTLCKEHEVPWSYDVREDSHSGTSKYRKTARVHATILRNTLRSSVVAMQAEKCSKLMLGGRDVWALVVLAARQEIPYLFIPELSRYVAKDPVVKDFLVAKGFTGEELFVDTGFMGSIPRSLEQHFERPFKFRLMSQNHTASGGVHADRKPQQLFPCRRVARDEALETEYLAKYWKSGSVGPNGIFQYFGDRPQIQRAALMTSMLWRGVDTFNPVLRHSDQDLIEDTFYKKLSQSPKWAAGKTTSKTLPPAPLDSEVKESILTNALKSPEGRSAILAAMRIPIQILEEQADPKYLYNVNSKLNILKRIAAAAQGEPAHDPKGPTLEETRQKLLALRQKILAMSHQ